MLAMLTALVAGIAPPSPAGRTCSGGSCWSVPHPPPIQPSYFVSHASIICGRLEVEVVNYNEQDRALPVAAEIGAVFRTDDRREFVDLVPQDPGIMIEKEYFRRSTYVARLSDPHPGNGSLDDGTDWHIDVTDTGFCPNPS